MMNFIGMYKAQIMRVLVYFIVVFIINIGFKNRLKVYSLAFLVMALILGMKFLGYVIRPDIFHSENFFWSIFPFFTMVLYLPIIYNPVKLIYSITKPLPIIFRILILVVILGILGFLWLFFFAYSGGVYLYRAF